MAIHKSQAEANRMTVRMKVTRAMMIPMKVVINREVQMRIKSIKMMKASKARNKRQMNKFVKMKVTSWREQIQQEKTRK